MRIKKSRVQFILLLYVLVAERFVSYLLGLVGAPELPANYIYLLCFVVMLSFVRPSVAMLFVAFAGMGVIRAIYVEGSLDGAGEFVTFAAFCLACFAVTSPVVQKMVADDLEWLNKSIFIFAVVFALTYVASTIIGGIKYVHADGRQEGVYGFVWPHGFGYFMSIIAGTMFCSGNRKKGIVFAMVAFISNSRTALLINSFMLVKFIRTYAASLNRAWLILLAPVASVTMILAGYLALQFYADLPGLDRLVKSADTVDWRNFHIDALALEAFTSGRSVFWDRMSASFFSNQFDSMDRMLGLGAATVRTLNMRNVGMGIWMHNDWLQALYAYGYVGIIVYSASIVALFRAVKFNLVVILFVAASSILNGLYTYMGVSLVFILYIYAQYDRIPNSLVNRRFSAS